MTLPRLIGMVHLGALPGAPGFSGSLGAVVAAAVGDAAAIEAAGFDGLMVENFGDAPFHPDDVPKETVAAMTMAVAAVIHATGMPTGVNVLRNDAAAALAVAAATGAAFIRVNVLSGLMYSDQGPLVGRAAEVARLRARLCPDVAILADVFVKHATPPAGWALGDAARDLGERAGADAILVSGPGTGVATAEDDLETVRRATSLPVYVASGATADTVASLLAVADGVIVGSSLKVKGDPTGPVDPVRAAAFIAAAG